MKTTIDWNNSTLSIDLSKPIDISRTIRNGVNNPKCFYAPDTQFEPVKMDGFVGAISEGGSVNFKNIFINPHGSSTHTECVGHISGKEYFLNETLKNFFFKAQLVSIYPRTLDNGDKIIDTQCLEGIGLSNDINAIIIRTMPNDETKINRNYSDTNPPYFHHEFIEFLVENGVDHFLTDLPSVDREVDGAEFKSHKALWSYPEDTQQNRTITELIYVPNIIMDGDYLLNIQCLNIELDVSPSRPVLYKIEAD